MGFHFCFSHKFTLAPRTSPIPVWFSRNPMHTTGFLNDLSRFEWVFIGPAKRSTHQPFESIDPNRSSYYGNGLYFRRPVENTGTLNGRLNFSYYLNFWLG